MPPVPDVPTLILSFSFRNVTTCCRPLTPPRCRCTEGSLDVDTSLKPMSCCRSLARSPSTGRICDPKLGRLSLGRLLEAASEVTRQEWQQRLYSGTSCLSLQHAFGLKYTFTVFGRERRSNTPDHCSLCHLYGKRGQETEAPCGTASCYFSWTLGCSVGCVYLARPSFAQLGFPFLAKYTAPRILLRAPRPLLAGSGTFCKCPEIWG